MANLPETMKALVVHGTGDYRLEKNFPVPRADEGEIIIKN